MRAAPSSKVETVASFEESSFDLEARALRVAPICRSGCRSSDLSKLLGYENVPPYLKDIMISGAPKVEKTKSTRKLHDQNHIGTRYHYSLRVGCLFPLFEFSWCHWSTLTLLRISKAYLSILYLHLPPTFRIILRGQVVEPHHIVKDLIFCECIRYCPHGGDKEEPIITTIGFLEGSPLISITGFSVYHKNRLILPFWSAFIRGNTKCRGIAGVLEVNNLKPTHNKQDFERSNLFVKLEARLRDMSVEYWFYQNFC